LPANALHLSFQDLDLSSEGEDFSLKSCLISSADIDQIDEQPDNRVDRACYHPAEMLTAAGA